MNKRPTNLPQQQSLRTRLSYALVVSLILCLAACVSTGKNPDGVPGSDLETQAQSASIVDQATQREVILALAGEPGLDATRIGVSCIAGVVTLRGSVDTQLERQLAGNAAIQVKGVVEVRNLLTSF